MDENMDTIPPVDDPVDKYHLGDVIGKGSFGVVVRAIHIELNEVVAIKTVQCISPENVELALEEFRSHSKLPIHPNVVTLRQGISDINNIRSVIKHGDKNCSEYLDLVSVALKGDISIYSHVELLLVLDYCNGGDLNDYLLSRPPNAALNTSVLEQLATAVTFLHDHQVMHRDLKPENIMIKLNKICKENEPPLPTIKIGDFGLAKVLSSTTDKAKSQELYSACGSDYFMAPEVFQSKYNLKADVFSLGIIFWAVVDRITFKDSNTQKVLLGTYVQKDGKIMPMGEALLEDPHIAISQLLVATSVEKKIIYKSDDESRKNTSNQRTEHDGSTCFQGDIAAVRDLICSMVACNSEDRPTAKTTAALIHKYSASVQSVLSGTQSAPTANRSRRSAIRAPPLDSPKPVETKKRKRRQRPNKNNEVSTPAKTPTRKTRRQNYRDSKDLKLYTSPVPPAVDMPQTAVRQQFTPNYIIMRNKEKGPRCGQCFAVLKRCPCTPTRMYTHQGESHDHPVLTDGWINFSKVDVDGKNWYGIGPDGEEAAGFIPAAPAKGSELEEAPPAKGSEMEEAPPTKGSELEEATTSYTPDGRSFTQNPLPCGDNGELVQGVDTVFRPAAEFQQSKEAPPAVKLEPEETPKKIRRAKANCRTTKPYAKQTRKRVMSTRNKKELTKGEASVNCDVSDNNQSSTEQPIVGNKRKGPAPSQARVSKRLRLQSESSASESVVVKEETIELVPFATEPLPAETPAASNGITSFQPTSSQAQVGSSISANIKQVVKKKLWRPHLDATSSTSSPTRRHMPTSPETTNFFHPPQPNAGSVASSRSPYTVTTKTSPPSIAYQSSSVSRKLLYLWDPLPTHTCMSSSGEGTSSTSVSSDVASTSRVVQQPNIVPDDYLRSMEIAQWAEVAYGTKAIRNIDDVITTAAVTSFSRSLPTVRPGTNMMHPAIPFTPTTDLDPRIYSNGVKSTVRDYYCKDIYTDVSKIDPTNIYTVTNKCFSSPSTTNSVSSYQLVGDETNSTTAANLRVPIPPVTEAQPELIKHYKARMKKRMKMNAAQESCSPAYKEMLLNQAAEAATQNHQHFVQQHPVYQQTPFPDSRIMVRTLESHIGNNLQQSADSFLRADQQLHQRMNAVAPVNNSNLLSSIYGPVAALLPDYQFYSRLISNIYPSVALQSTSNTRGNLPFFNVSAPSLPGTAANHLQFSPALAPNDAINLASDYYRRSLNMHRAINDITYPPTTSQEFMPTRSLPSTYQDLMNLDRRIDQPYHQPFPVGVAARHPAPLGSQAGRP